MEIGTLDTNVTTEEKKNRRPKITNSKGGGGGGRRNRGGGGGDSSGGDDGNNPSLTELEDFRPNKYRIGMWFMMMVVLMTFSGLIGAYVVISSNGIGEWQPFNLPIPVWISTVILLFSSISYSISRNKLKNGEQKQAKTWLLATTVLGTMFISSQLLSWIELYARGVYVWGNPYAGFFYILTAVHALHVFGGICCLGYLVLRTWNPTFSDDELVRRQTVSTVVGWYWHLMDGLWVVLFLLLGFFK